MRTPLAALAVAVLLLTGCSAASPAKTTPPPSPSAPASPTADAPQDASAEAEQAFLAQITEVLPAELANDSSAIASTLELGKTLCTVAREKGGTLADAATAIGKNAQTEDKSANVRQALIVFGTASVAGKTLCPEYAE